MGDSPDTTWPDDDGIDWVRLYALAPNLWRSYLADLEEQPSPVELARFTDRCIRSVRCLTDLHARLPGIGLSLAAFAELHARAWAAQFDRQTDDWSENRESWPDPPVELRDVLADEMREAVINLHLRGLEHDRITCALGIPADWPALVIADADFNPKAADVVAAHLEGKSLGQIEKATGVPASTALRIIRRIGEKPNGAKRRVDAAARARDIVKLRARGLAYKEIAERLDCDLDDVKNALRRDRRHRYGGGSPAE